MLPASTKTKTARMVRTHIIAFISKAPWQGVITVQVGLLEASKAKAQD